MRIYKYWILSITMLVTICFFALISLDTFVIRYKFSYQKKNYSWYFHKNGLLYHPDDLWCILILMSRGGDRKLQRYVEQQLFPKTIEIRIISDFSKPPNHCQFLTMKGGGHQGIRIFLRAAPMQCCINL